MKSMYKRLLLLGLGLSLVALAGLQGLDEDQIEGRVDDDHPEPDGREPIPFPVPKKEENGNRAMAQPIFIPATTVTFSGKLIRNGSLLALRETAGTLYTLDGIGRVLPFEGKDVRVTGKLDITRTLLHVDAIEQFVA